MQFVAVELGIATRRACDASGAALARGLSGSSVSVLVFWVDMAESSFAGRWPAALERLVGDAPTGRPVCSLNQS